MGVADWILSAAAVVAVPLVTWLVARSARRATAERDTIVDLRTRVTNLETTSRIQADYIFALRGHIADHKPPPPPAWPEGMNR